MQGVTARGGWRAAGAAGDRQPADRARRSRSTFALFMGRRRFYLKDPGTVNFETGAVEAAFGFAKCRGGNRLAGFPHDPR
jgi:hypothetical protein